MKWILKIEHWQIFLIRGVGIALLAVDVPNYEIISLIIKAIAVFLIYGWFVFTGIEIIGLTKRKILTTGFFIFNNFYAIVATLIIVLFYDGSFNVSGPVALTVLYFFFAIIYTYYFLGKALTSVEKNTRTDFDKHVIDSAMFLIYPIGIWRLQPRINKLAQQFEEQE